MPRKTSSEKLDARLLMSLSPALKSGLEDVALRNDCSVQELLRRAAAAIMACQQEFGSVPLDMRLIQKAHRSAQTERMGEFSETSLQSRRGKASSG